LIGNTAEKLDDSLLTVKPEETSSRRW